MNALRRKLLSSVYAARRAGEGERYGLREYHSGDDARHIHWTAYARTGFLLTRKQEMQDAISLVAVIDTSASMNVGRRRPLSASAAEAVQCWFSAAQSGDRRVRIPLAGDTAPLASLLQRAAHVVHGDAALLVVSDFHDLHDERTRRMAEQLAVRCTCTALIARDPWREGLPLRGFVRIRDAESVRHCTLFIGRAQRQAYRRAVLEREAGMRRFFERAHWRTGTIDESDGASALLQAFGF